VKLIDRTKSTIERPPTTTALWRSLAHQSQSCWGAMQRLKAVQPFEDQGFQALRTAKVQSLNTTNLQNAAHTASGNASGGSS
jgi:hypothetical protein